MKIKQILVTTALVTAGVLAIGRSTSKAALQANSTTHNSPKSATGASWIQSIREMEKAGQTMGLNETLKDDLTPNTSNNIDVHMMKTTEYGAMAILSASNFGNQKKLQESTIKSTTGNVTGVYVTGDRWEWTAGVKSDSTVGKDKRYYDLYTDSQTSAKVGDALGLDTYTSNPGCAGWHGAVLAWFDYYGDAFVRGKGGVFASWGAGDGISGAILTDFLYWSEQGFCGRGVAVVQSGV